MAFSSLYSAVCRGKWFISFRDVEANLILVDKLLERGITKEDAEKRSDVEPIPVLLSTGGKEAKSGNGFADAPKDSTAIIPIHGTLLKYGTYCSYGTTELADILRQAAESSNISSVLLDIDSGGGSVDAIAPLVDAIQYAQSKGKSVVAHCDLCASAAYYIASYCDEIIASNQISSEFGSIGVMMSFPDYAKYYEREGVKVHTIYSSLSDYKNAPFEMAKEGKYEMIREEELDPLARDFQENVKANRGNKLKLDTTGLVRGRMFYAKDAIAVGLADAIGTLDFAIQRAREIPREACINEYINSKS
ncbi:S49 family peptidase [Bacteroides cellulosilyticus]|uniref:S49 family peptidase n=1 Tax=Bacteroides cellulosilyticus TaxID=246787 RepID=UPI00101BFCE1|nr:S49 family peptidase [Bacteroides cellulosilyticus]